jgi:hypothetical protein
MIRNLLILVLIIVAANTFGQTRDSSFLPKSEIKLSYLGSIKYPGLRLGSELPMRLKQIINTEQSKIIYKVSSLTLNLSWYHQKDFHDNIYFTTEWQMRKIATSGWFTELSPGIGYSRTFLGGTTYKAAGDGNVSIKKLAGYNYILLILSAGFGYDLSMKEKKPLKIFTKLSAISMYPNNSFVYIRPTIELGLAYTPKLFIKTNPFIKTKRK